MKLSCPVPCWGSLNAHMVLLPPSEAKPLASTDLCFPTSFPGCLHCFADHFLHIPLLERYPVLPKNHHAALLAIAQTGTFRTESRMGEGIVDGEANMEALCLGEKAGCPSLAVRFTFVLRLHHQSE